MTFPGWLVAMVAMVATRHGWLPRLPTGGPPNKCTALPGNNMVNHGVVIGPAVFFQTKSLEDCMANCSSYCATGMGAYNWGGKDCTCRDAGARIGPYNASGGRDPTGFTCTTSCSAGEVAPSTLNGAGSACDWERATYQLGLIEFYHASADPDALAQAYAWAESIDYKLCRYNVTAGMNPQQIQDAGPHNADHQLAGATFAELYNIDRNQSHIADMVEIFNAEITTPIVAKNWSWIDAIHMGMNPYARLGNVTGKQKYLDKMFELFNQTAFTAELGPYHKALWDNSTKLFFRDGSYVRKGIFWSRANGWAITALANSIRFAKSAVHLEVYTAIFKDLATKLATVQGSDGAWRASLLNASGFPDPETTGTANFVYGMAWGVRTGLLDSATFLPVIDKGWNWLSATAIQPNGLVGYCQPVGASPASITPAMTSNFCVGQFLLAAAEVSKLTK